MHLNRDELQLVSDPGIIERKKKITDLIIASFNELGKKVHSQAELPPFFSGLLNHNSWKVTRGENFHGYPFILLDTPRLINTESPLAMRTLFWWGHHFSLHFMIRRPAPSAMIEKHFDHSLLLYTGSNCWEQNTGSEEFVPLSKQSFSAYRPHVFFKMALNIPLHEHEELETKALRFYSDCMELFKD
jgi:hypothetical protein